jgi:SAM-dependent methyltransferase
MNEERENWNKRYRTGEFEPPETPSPLLQNAVDTLPQGQALDIATGTGRNALFLAEQGYEVDAIDISDEALGIARKRAAERSLSINWIQADIDDYGFPEQAYDVVMVNFYTLPHRLPDVKEALTADGVLLYEHHLRSADSVECGPSSDRYRFRSNDLLRSCLDLTVLHYEEKTRVENGRKAAIVTLIGRNSSGSAQEYPTYR